MSAEDPSSSRTARASPQHQTNGHEGSGSPPSRIEEKRGSVRQTHPEHQSTGPASLASAFTNSHSDYSDVNSGYNGGRARPGRFNCGHREQVVHGSGPGSVGRLRPSSKHLFNVTCGFEESPSHQSPAQRNTAEHGLSAGEGGCSGPPAGPRPGSVAAASPVDSFRYSDQNGCSSAPLLFDEGRASPLPARSSRLQKLPKAGAQSDPDPNQGASSGGQEHCPTLSRAEHMAALERRMLANGLSAPGRSRSGHGRKRKAHAGAALMGGVQMNDCGATSGSESSESEAESNRGSGPQTAVNPVESSFTSSLPRSKFSFGSLQLDEEADEEGCSVLSDEDGGQIFNC